MLWPHPTPEECARVVEALQHLHGEVPQRSTTAKSTVLDTLIHTILSQNTTSNNSTRAFASLQQTFGHSWQSVLAAPVEDVAHSIRMGGLANIKAARIQAILGDVERTYGQLDLEHLRNLDDEAAQKELLRFKGVGPKTASCVLLFALGRESFAVDTHVFRISRQLGWLPPKATRDQAFTHLDAAVPNPLKYPLHMLLIRHGKTCPHCAANGQPQLAPCGPCPL